MRSRGASRTLWTPATRSSHAGAPTNDMVPTMLLACLAGLAHACRSRFANPALDHGEKFKGNSEKFEGKVRIFVASRKLSEKLRSEVNDCDFAQT
jgi:hypothetical protein